MFFPPGASYGVNVFQLTVKKEKRKCCTTKYEANRIAFLTPKD